MEIEAGGRRHLVVPITGLLGGVVGACYGCGVRIMIKDIPWLGGFFWPLRLDIEELPHPMWSEERPPVVPAQDLAMSKLELRDLEGSRA